MSILKTTSKEISALLFIIIDNNKIVSNCKKNNQKLV